MARHGKWEMSWRFSPMLFHADSWCMVHGMRILMDIYWLVVYLPLWKIWVRQLGWWYSQYMESHKSHVPNHLSQREITGLVQIPGAGKSSNLLEDWKKTSHVWWPECNASNIKLPSSIGLVLQQVAKYSWYKEAGHIGVTGFINFICLFYLAFLDAQ